MTSQAATDWLSYFEEIAADLGIPATVDTTATFQLRVEADSPAVGRIHTITAADRSHDRLQVEVDHEREHLEESSDMRVVSVLLETATSEAFDLDSDHFIFVPEDLLEAELTEHDTLEIDSAEPGRYDDAFQGYADNWNALCEYLAGTTFPENVSGLLDTEPTGGEEYTAIEVRRLITEYRTVVDWEDRHAKDKQTEEAVTALSEAIIEEYDGWAGTGELTALYQLCQTPGATSAETKKQRVAELELSSAAVEAVTEHIDETIGIVGGGKAQITIPSEYEADAYRLLETMVTAEKTAELETAIESFAALDISGIQAGVLSPIFYFHQPETYPVINNQSREGMRKAGGYEISDRLTEYTTEARKYREFRDAYELGRPDGNLRDVDWFFYNLNEGIISLSEPTVWVEKTAIHGQWKESGETELSLGRAIMSPQESTGGQDIYWQLREADVGDIVVHLLQDEYTIAGASVIESELITDYDFPEYIEQRWEPSQRADGGYLRRLTDYTEFSDPIALRTELFEHPDYTDRLDEIREEYSGLFYTKNRALVQGGYLTKCPDDLATVLADASDELREYFASHGLAVDSSVSGPDNGGGQAETTSPTYYLWNTNLEHEGTDGRGAFARGVIAAYGDKKYGKKLTKPDVGDIVFAYRNKTGIIGVGEVLASMELEPLDKSDPDVDPIKPDGIEYHRPVDWIYTLPDSEAITPADAADILNRGNMSRVATTERPSDQTGAADLYHEVRSRFQALHDSESTAAYQHSEIRRLIEKKKQLVFYGPPGTGKTYTARRFAEWYRATMDANASGKQQIRTVTFHPSFAYEDFIEGFTASVEGAGQVAYDYEKGTFAEIVADARHAYEHTETNETPPPFFLIIDEINRGNLAQIFGETITLVEADKRLGEPNEVIAQLAHSGDEFVVPPNLYLIGTMNTADESIALVDTALRRRFRFLSFPPQPRAVAATYPDLLGQADLKATLTTTGDPTAQLLAASLLAIEELNSQIRTLQHLGKGKQIGHTYLYDLANPQEIVDTWRFEILPQLEEYYFGQFDALEQELFTGVTVSLFNSTSQEIIDFDAETLYEGLCDLVGLDETERPAFTAAAAAPTGSRDGDA